MFNESTLTNFEQCSECGNCCKSFWFWVQKQPGMSERFLSLEGEEHRVITQTMNPEKELIEIVKECSHLSNDGSCRVYGTSDRPNLCNSFPDSLFNRDNDGTLILDNKRARDVIELYSDYCPAVSALKE